MHNKAVFALAAIFLIVAVVVPVIILSLQAQSDLENLIITQNPSGSETGNFTIPDIAKIQASHQTTYIIVITVAAIFILLSILMLYYGINHIHPDHTKPH